MLRDRQQCRGCLLAAQQQLQTPYQQGSCHVAALTVAPHPPCNVSSKVVMTTVTVTIMLSSFWLARHAQNEAKSHVCRLADPGLVETCGWLLDVQLHVLRYVVQACSDAKGSFPRLTGPHLSRILQIQRSKGDFHRDSIGSSHA